jgi:hypothetical protein
MTVGPDEERFPVDWSAVWSAVAARFTSHRVAGRGHLLSEHTLRWETMMVLEECGVRPGRLVVEHRAPELGGGSLDLVIDPPAGTVIEFKFPRGSSTGISPDTMTFGELLKDFLRVSVVPAEERWVVQVLDPRLRRYLQNAGTRSSFVWADTPGAILELPLDVLAALPKTARDALGALAVLDTVRARCTDVVEIDKNLALIAYRVDGAPTVSAKIAKPPSAPAVSAVASVREGAQDLGRTD